MKKIFTVFTKTELAIMSGSILTILIAFFAFGGEGYLSLIASLIGAVSLMFCAKGNPLGQVLIIIFSILYGIISFDVGYYGEMITYVGMSAPMAVFALIAWIKNPAEKGKSEVKAYRLTFRDALVMILLALAVTFAFYFILKFFGTSNLPASTLSVTTSFAAVYLTYKRSPFYALAYALNDVVLIAMWIFAMRSDSSYVSVVTCFLVFLLNDLYGFFSWQRMQKRQEEKSRRENADQSL